MAERLNKVADNYEHPSLLAKPTSACKSKDVIIINFAGLRFNL